MERSSSEMFTLLEDKTELIYLIDKLLNDLLGETREMARTGSRFECKEVPGISVLDYLRSNHSLSQESASTHTAPKAPSSQR